LAPRLPRFIETLLFRQQLRVPIEPCNARELSP
jgi:hypothetical protein